MLELSLFHGEEHQTFYWESGAKAALLLHGFPGTPAELRPLAETLHVEGWSVQGLLLPGFGSEIASLPERDHSEWTAAVHAALADLRRDHHTVLLAGYSMGASVAIQAAAQGQPDGLILLAPFWRIGTWWQQFIGTLLRPVVSEIRPLAKADFSEPSLRKGISSFFPGIDLDDVEAQRSLRELSFPVRLLDNLRAAGKRAYSLASEVRQPCLILQGSDDSIVLPHQTRKLSRRLSGPVEYVEVDAGHQLLDPTQSTWDELTRRILTFARSYEVGKGP